MTIPLVQADTSQIEGDEQLVQRLLQEGPRAWARLIQDLHVQTGSFTRFRADPGGTPQPEQTVQFYLNGDNIRFDYQRKSRSLDVSLVCNADYAFAVSRPSGDPQAKWALNWLRQRDGNPDTEKAIRDRGAEYYQTVTTAWGFLGTGMAAQLNASDFTVKRVTAVEDADDDLIRVDYTYLPVDPEKGGELIEPGYVVFNSDKSWRIEEIDMRRPWGFSHGVLSYDDAADTAFPMMTKWHDSVGSHEKITIEFLCEYHDVTDDVTPPERFRLPEFGLPEPNFRNRKLLTWLIVLGLAAACFAAARHIRRRRQSE